MSFVAARGLAGEARRLVQVLRGGLPTPSRVGPLVVSGVLAEQLAKELGTGADAGAVRLGGDVPDVTAEALVRVIAGDPTEVDDGFVRASDAEGVPVVLVQLWPQADWTRPFVLSPHVVECRAGEGFPVRAIGSAVVDAVERRSQLASTVPVLRPSLERKVVMESVARTAVLGTFPRGRHSRPSITLEQVRMATRLNALGGVRIEPSREVPVVAAVASSALAVGFALRGVARRARLVLPDPIANGLVAAAGTFALAKAIQALSGRDPG